MQPGAGKKRGNLTIENGGTADEVRRRADVELELALREVFFAMRGRDGKSINKNFRNAARGHTKLVRAYMRRIKEARLARNHAVNYPLAKMTVEQLDRWVDAQFMNACRPPQRDENEAA